MTDRQRWLKLTNFVGFPVWVPVASIAAVVRDGGTTVVYPLGTGLVTGNGWRVMETPEQIVDASNGEVFIIP